MLWTKKNHFPLVKSSVDSGADWKDNAVIKDYVDFYNRHHNENLCMYGLLPLAAQGGSPFYDKAYSETLQYDFPFTSPCIWEEIQDIKKALEAEDKVQYGNITIGYEGCGIYWIYIICGQFAGQVWLMTEQGVTPLMENMTLSLWRDNMIKTNGTFWHGVLNTWGHRTGVFFANHAAVKSAAYGDGAYASSRRLCQSCLDYISGYAAERDEEIVVSDPCGTRVFYTDRTIKFV